MDFDALLKNTLTTVNDNFQSALADLREIVAQVSAAIQRNAGDQFGFEVSEETSDMKGSTYRVFLDTNITDSKAKIITIAHFRIPAVGYPVALGSIAKSPFKNFLSERTIEDKEALEVIFTEFLQDPESPLIQALGYALRSTGDEGDIPF